MMTFTGSFVGSITFPAARHTLASFGLGLALGPYMGIIAGAAALLVLTQRSQGTWSVSQALANYSGSSSAHMEAQANLGRATERASQATARVATLQGNQANDIEGQQGTTAAPLPQDVPVLETGPTTVVNTTKTIYGRT